MSDNDMGDQARSLNKTLDEAGKAATQPVIPLRSSYSLGGLSSLVSHRASNSPEQVNYGVLTRARSFSRAAGIFVMLVGALSLTGWLLDIDELKSVYGDITMKANAALSLLLAGGSLWLLSIDNKEAFAHRGCQMCATTISVVGILTLSEHIFGWNLGIDQLLFTEPAGA